MSDTTFNTFAVAGAGHLGGSIVKELGKYDKSTIILTRASGSGIAPDLATLPNIHSKAVDYASEDSLVSALKGADVVISTLNGAGLASQPALIRAAKKADVKLFVPSEYGSPLEGLEGTPLQKKVDARKLLEEINLPYAGFVTGGFADWITLHLGWPLNENTSLSIVGKGDTPISVTSVVDIARFVAHAVATFPAEQLRWKEFRIEGDKKTFNEMATLLSKQIGRDLPVTHRDYAKTKSEALNKEGFAAFADWIRCILEEGRGDAAFNAQSGKSDVPLSNGLWPEWRPETLSEFFAAQNLH